MEMHGWENVREEEKEEEGEKEKKNREKRENEKIPQFDSKTNDGKMEGQRK